MYNFLSSLLLAGAAVSAPTPLTPRQAEESCVKRSQDMNLWDVKQFDFHASYIFSTPAHQNSWGYVNFTLANPAVPYKPVCSAESNWLNDFYYGGEQIYECDSGDDATTATWSFSRPSGELRINQTWNCVDEGGRFEAQGGVKLNLTCEETKWENPDWSQGSIYSTRNIDCNFVDAEAPVEEMSAVLRRV